MGKTGVLLTALFGPPVAAIGLAILIFPDKPAWATGVGGAIGLFAGMISAGILADNSKLSAAQVEANKAQEDLEKKLGQSPNPLDVAILNMRKLDRYYSLNEQQAHRSFNISVGAVAVGFIVLIFVVRFLQDRDSKIVGTVAAAMMQLIGGGFFFLYKKSLDQLNLFYGKLMTLQTTMLALQLCQSLTTEKEDTTKQIALALIHSSGMAGTGPAAVIEKPRFPVPSHLKSAVRGAHTLGTAPPWDGQAHPEA